MLIYNIPAVKKNLDFFPIRPEIHKKKKPRSQINKKERYMDTGCKKMFSQCDGHILAFQGVVNPSKKVSIYAIGFE